MNGFLRTQSSLSIRNWGLSGQPSEARGVSVELLSPRYAVDSGAYKELSELTGLKIFCTEFADHSAGEVAR